MTGGRVTGVLGHFCPAFSVNLIPALTVVAEGVEHEIQKQYLLNWGCDKIQGYLVSKPLDEEAAIDMLKNSINAL